MVSFDGFYPWENPMKKNPWENSMGKYHVKIPPKNSKDISQNLVNKIGYNETGTSRSVMSFGSTYSVSQCQFCFNCKHRAEGFARVFCLYPSLYSL